MRPLKLLGTFLAISVALIFWSRLSLAQPAPPMVNDYAVTYFSGNTSGNPDETLRVINTGFLGDPDMPTGDICANVYVFDATQELTECCSCQVSANGMLTFSVQSNLTANSVTGHVAPTGVIKVTANPVPPTGCNATASGPILPSEQVFGAWMSHLNPATAGKNVTEEELTDRPLSPSELGDLQQDCAAALELGSGQGACTCPPAT